MKKLLLRVFLRTTRKFSRQPGIKRIRGRDRRARAVPIQLEPPALQAFLADQDTRQQGSGDVYGFPVFGQDESFRVDRDLTD